MNNLAQLFDEHDELDSCCLCLFTDKGADHNPTHFEVILIEAKLFMDRKLWYFGHFTHCGGLSAYNTAAERLNASETQAIVNVPIAASAYGPALRSDGSFDPLVAHKNFQWEMDELALRLEQASFCGESLAVHQAASMTGWRWPPWALDPETEDDGASQALECKWEDAKYSESFRLSLRRFYDGEKRVRAGAIYHRKLCFSAW
jgi:hypothetical protein